MFSKVTATLLGGLLGGILITGVGAGIATVEFTSFEIDSETLMQESNVVTDEFTYEMMDGELIEIPNPNCTVVFNETVPEGTVLMEVTYAPDLTYIDSWIDTYTDSEGRHYSILQLYTYYRGYDNILVNHKDLILQGLKDGVLYVYENDYVGGADNSTKIVKLNPADKDRLLNDSPDYYNMEYAYGNRM